MTDVTNAKADGDKSLPGEERDIKFTAKGLAYLVVVSNSKKIKMQTSK